VIEFTSPESIIEKPTAISKPSRPHGHAASPGAASSPPVGAISNERRLAAPTAPALSTSLIIVEPQAERSSAATLAHASADLVCPVVAAGERNHEIAQIVEALAVPPGAGPVDHRSSLPGPR